MPRSLISELEGKQSENEFLKVLHMGRRFREMDPRDYVYAFLGHKTALNPKTHVLLVSPDYRKYL